MCFKSSFFQFSFLFGSSVFFFVVALIDKFARHCGSRIDKNLRAHTYGDWRVGAVLHCPKLLRATRNAPTRRCIPAKDFVRGPQKKRRNDRPRQQMRICGRESSMTWPSAS